MSAVVKPLKLKKQACPICKRPVDEKFLPFCSRRCADADLSRWLTGAYAIPVIEEDKSALPQADDED